MILESVKELLKAFNSGKLGGEIMPEDSNPALNKESNENLIYFTLPMSLNYQRNSYKLWEAALVTFNDSKTCDVFDPEAVIKMTIDELRKKLIKYKIVLQPNKQPVIWQKLCKTIVDKFDGDLRTLFLSQGKDIGKIKKFILENKKDFPYLSGTKILNYWMYVISVYTDLKLTNREAISIAPDTHVLQASVRLGIINEKELTKSNIRELAAERWAEILKDTKLLPVDLHTPLWLWSRGGFKIKIGEKI